MRTQKLGLSYEDYAAGIHTLKPEELLRLMDLISASLRKSLNRKAGHSIMEPEGNMSDYGDSEEDMRLFWESFGSWKDDRATEEIVKDIYGARKSVERSIQL